MSEVSAEDRWEAPVFPDPTTMPTASELEELQRQAYEEAYQEAYAKGMEAGREAGLAAAEEEVNAQLALLDAGIDALGKPLAELEEALEQQLVHMVGALVGRLFRRQLDLDPDSVIGLVRDAASRLPIADRQINIHVHPDDAERLQALGATVAADDQAQRWTVIPDPSLTRGGCLIQCPPSEIDVRVETRIEQMVHELVGDQRA